MHTNLDDRDIRLIRQTIPPPLKRMIPLPPTRVLPALAILQACSAARVGDALRALRDVYFPHILMAAMTGAIPVLRRSLSEAVRPKRMARLVLYDSVPDSGYASAEEGEEDDGDDGAKITEIRDAATEEDEASDMDLLRSDELERGYAIKWLTGLVKRGDAWVDGTPSSEEQEARATCLDDAARLLARFAGDDTPEEALTRSFVFPFRTPSWGCCCPLDDSPITVELNDAPVDGTDHTAVGLQSWGSAIVFAERMCLDPERYLGTLHPCTSIPATRTNAKSMRRRRLLELGAGTGLLSITSAQILSRTSVQAKIKATDYHPSVLANLARNVQHNHCTADVSVEKLDWCAHVGGDAEGVEGEGRYDVVLAADVVYHPEHAHWIRGCVERTMKKDGVFWLVIPKRTIGRHEGLGRTVEEAFPVVGHGQGRGARLAVVGREEMARVDGIGRADEGGYTLFEIRWV